MAQGIDSIICEACYLSEQCNRQICPLYKAVKKQNKEMLDILMTDYDKDKDLR